MDIFWQIVIIIIVLVGIAQAFLIKKCFDLLGSVVKLQEIQDKNLGRTIKSVNRVVEFLQGTFKGL
jgi:hypothetical protein